MKKTWKTHKKLQYQCITQRDAKHHLIASPKSPDGNQLGDRKDEDGVEVDHRQFG